MCNQQPRACFAAHGSCGERQELHVSCMRPSPQLTGIPWATSPDPLRGPAVKLCCVWSTLHQPRHIQQVRVTPAGEWAGGPTLKIRWIALNDTEVMALDPLRPVGELLRVVNAPSE